MILEIDNNIIKQRLLDLKSKKKCTRIQIASRCNMPKETVNSHFSKNGRAKAIEISTLYKYSQFFDVSLDYLIAGKDNNNEIKKKTFEDNTPLEKADLIFAAIRVLLEAYGNEIVNFEQIDCGDYYQNKTELWIFDNWLRYYIDHVKSIVEQKDLLKKLGVYDRAWEEQKIQIWPFKDVVFNENKQLIELIEGDLPF